MAASQGASAAGADADGAVNRDAFLRWRWDLAAVAGAVAAAEADDGRRRLLDGGLGRLPPPAERPRAAATDADGTGVFGRSRPAAPAGCWPSGTGGASGRPLSHSI